MKKVNFKKVLMALVAVFALSLFSVERAEAQVSNDALIGVVYGPATGTFLGSNEAKDVLKSVIPDLKNSLATLTPGTPAYNAVYRTFRYYVGIYEELVSGKSVSEAIGTGLYVLTNTVDGPLLTQTQLLNLRQGAIDLLQ